jgi:hypothetical protein
MQCQFKDKMPNGMKIFCEDKATEKVGGRRYCKSHAEQYRSGTTQGRLKALEYSVSVVTADLRRESNVIRWGVAAALLAMVSAAFLLIEWKCHPCTPAVGSAGADLNICPSTRPRCDAIKEPSASGVISIDSLVEDVSPGYISNPVPFPASFDPADIPFEVCDGNGELRTIDDFHLRLKIHTGIMSHNAGILAFNIDPIFTASRDEFLHLFIEERECGSYAADGNGSDNQIPDIIAVHGLASSSVGLWLPRPRLQRGGSLFSEQ